MDEPNSLQDPHTPLGRRDLIKALAAGSGALAVAAFLPGKWAKPLVQSGVLPAHAQSTCVAYQLGEAAGGWCDGTSPFGCVDAASNFVTVSWSPLSGVPVGVSILYGGVPAVIVNQTVQTGGAVYAINPGNGAQGFTGTITLTFARGCPPVSADFEVPN
jgi:hypothetical protein